MTLAEIKAAVLRGDTVHWASDIYRVVHDNVGQWLIHCTMNDHYIGLTWRDGVTMNGREDQFYLKSKPKPSPQELAIDRAIAASGRHGQPINPQEARQIKRLIKGRHRPDRGQGVKP